MKKLKKILPFLLILLGMQKLTGIDKSLENQTKWAPQSNDQYIYNKSVSKKSAKSLFGQLKHIEKSENITISHHIFDTGITRTKTTIEPIDDEVQITVETWTTMNPSYRKSMILFGIALAMNIDTVNKITIEANLLKIPYYSVWRARNLIRLPSDIYDESYIKDFKRTLPSHIISTLYDVATDPILGTFLAYYLYQQYLKYQQTEQDKKNPDLEKATKTIE